MAGVAVASPKQQYLDASGNPLAGGFVYTYLAGTTTETNTWRDRGQATLNTNPIVLDANGSCSLILDDSLTYKIVVTDSAGVTQSHLGGDNIVGASGLADIAEARDDAIDAIEAQQTTSVTAVQTAQTTAVAAVDALVTEAEAAAEAATTAAAVYADTAAGIAATVDGESFSVFEDDYLIVYLNDTEVAVEQGRFYLSSYTDTFVATDYGDTTDYLWAIIDSNKRKLLAISKDGTITGKITSTEIVAARGDRADLNTRLAQHTNDYGLPKRHLWGEWYLRETRQRLRKLALGESQQFTIASIGDSWTHLRTRYTADTAATLKTTYGDAGPGWTGFAWGFGGASNLWAGGNGNVSGTEVTVALTADWTVRYGTSAGPDICDIYSSTAGAKVTVTFAGTGDASAVVLHYIAGGSGNVRYRWNAGAWTALDISVGTGPLTSSLASVPTGTWTLEIESVSGTTTLCGVDVQKTSSGVRWHKLGSTGSAASGWIAPTASQWQAAITALAPNLVTILLGTNDQAAAVTAATFYSRMGTLVDRVRAAEPLADVLLVMPCANGVYSSPPISDYTELIYQLAAEKKCAFLDLQYLFGDSYSEYESSSDRPWFNVDGIHPEPSTGGRVIVDAILRTLTNA